MEEEKIKEFAKETGLRFNEGKLRYDLLHPVAQEGLVKVLTKGSIKYSPKNWEKGMSWTSVIASLKRHLAALESGEDYDKESFEKHIDHIQCNAHFLSAYYKIAPQFDDRNHSYLKGLKIGLDIDEVICDFTGGWAKLYKDQHSRPIHWQYDANMKERFQEMKDAGVLNKFYWGLSPRIKPEDIPFEVSCYITSRPAPNAITEEWIKNNGFPTCPVYTVQGSKVEAAKEAGIDIFVDDGFHNFIELNKAGILTYLWDAPHNTKYNVGFKRIKSFHELV